MSFAPKCPSCGSDGHTGGKFYGYCLTEHGAVNLGLDPERTSENAFGCVQCGHIFAGLSWDRAKPNDVAINIFSDTGEPYPSMKPEPFVWPPVGDSRARHGSNNLNPHR